MKVPFLDLNKQYQSISKEIDEAIQRVILNSSFIQGREVDEFESAFAQKQNSSHCIGVGNGTDALIIALKAIGIVAGDEVIVPANSFIATSEAVTAGGGKVVFADVEPDTYSINPQEIKKKINSKTKAIIPVHLYGIPAEMDKIVQLAKECNLFIIEDCAQAHLAEYKSSTEGWRKVGNFGQISTFSFYPGKNLGAYGDAGAILTNNEELAIRVRMLANHGRIAKYDHLFEGFNSRLDGLQAAILNVKIKYLEEWTEDRRRNVAHYLKLLEGIEGIEVPRIHSNSKPVWHLFVVKAHKREKLIEFLSKHEIQTGIHYPKALPNLKAYQYLNHNSAEFPISNYNQDKVLSLPLFPEMMMEQIEFVVDKIKEFYKH